MKNKPWTVTAFYKNGEILTDYYHSLKKADAQAWYLRNRYLSSIEKIEIKDTRPGRDRFFAVVQQENKS